MDNDYFAYKGLSNVVRKIPKVINGVEVLSIYPKIKGKPLIVVTKCINCNMSKDTRITDLKNGKSKSCLGCWLTRKEQAIYRDTTNIGSLNKGLRNGIK